MSTKEMNLLIIISRNQIPGYQRNNLLAFFEKLIVVKHFGKHKESKMLHFIKKGCYTSIKNSGNEIRIKGV